MYKIDIKIVELLERIMKTWKVKLHLPKFSHSNICIPINRGIFQEDSLSPLLFCQALNPLSELLNDSGVGYRLEKNGTRLSHALYMDDLKLYSKSEEELENMIEIVESFSNDVGMTLGIDKKGGEIMNKQDKELINNGTIKELNNSDSYKYLGFSQLLKFKKKKKNSRRE